MMGAPVEAHPASEARTAPARRAIHAAAGARHSGREGNARWRIATSRSRGSAGIWWCRARHHQIPVSRTFHAERFGMVPDRVGVSWMIYVAL